MGGSLVQDGKKPETISDLFKPSPLPRLPANPREKLPAITLSRPSEDFSIVRPRTNHPLKLTAQQESCRDMTQSESPRRLESTHCDVPVATPFPHQPKEGPTCTPREWDEDPAQPFIFGAPLPGPSPAKPPSDFAYAEEWAQGVRHTASGIARIGGWARPHHHEGHLGPAFKHRR